jgi:acyl-CoA reductase-like NAD-dependent aldehyde dehydrogenase
MSHIPCTYPPTGEIFDKIPISTPEDVQTAHKEMARAARIWGKKPTHERVRIMRKLQNLLVDSLDDITKAISRDTGKSRQDALAETFVMIDVLSYYCRNAEKWLRRERVGRDLFVFKQGYVEHRPWGVVAILAPFNYPFNLAMVPAISALLAGNTVMLKPSEATAGTGKLIEELFQRVPELSPFIRVLHGDGSTGAAMIESVPDFIFLTGSAPTALKIQETAYKHLIPTAFELGGKDPSIVLEDANIAEAAKWSVWGAFFNAGQTCMGVERVYVLDGVYDEFVEEAIRITKQMRMGHTLRAESPYHLGTLTTPRQVEIVDEHVQDAVQQGARILVGGRRDGMFYEPTIIVDVTNDMRIMQEETFGPVLPIMKVKNEAEAIRMANDSEFGLGATVWSDNLRRGERLARQLEAGTVVLNDAISQFAIPTLPFGGGKRGSGTGVTHGKAGLMTFTHPAAVTVGNTPHPLDIATFLRKPGQYRWMKAVIQFVFGTTLEQKTAPVHEILRDARAGSSLTMLAHKVEDIEPAQKNEQHRAHKTKLHEMSTSSTLKKLAAASALGAISALAFSLLRKGDA